jgi:hypothetical protein
LDLRGKQLTNLSKIVKKDKWKMEYDSELDELFYGKELIPKKSFLFSINDELNLYVTPDSKVNGIFIEYFALNYIEHNKTLKPVLAFFKPGRKKDKEKQNLAKEALEETLFNQAIGSVFNKSRLFAAIA